VSFKEELEVLQKRLAEVDLLSKPRASSSRGFTEFLVLKLGNLKLKMYQEKGHSLPHIHIDYGNRNHVASFSINPVEKLNGSLHKKYDRTVREWVSSNNEGLLIIWKKLQAGEDPKGLLPELLSNA